MILIRPALLSYLVAIYLIIAGSYHGGGPFRLYRWTGRGATPELLAAELFGDYTPEAIVIYPERGLHEFQILSDDGNRLIDGIPGKEIKDPARKTFRSFWLRW